MEFECPRLRIFLLTRVGIEYIYVWQEAVIEGLVLVNWLSLKLAVSSKLLGGLIPVIAARKLLSSMNKQIL